MFTLCKACSNTFKVDVNSTLRAMFTKDDQNVLHRIESVSDVCTHTDEERKFVAVVDTSELKHALDRGYKVRFSML